MAGMNLRLAFAVISSACWSAFQHGYNTGVLNAPQAIISDWLQKEVLTGTNVTISAMDDPKVTTAMSIAVAIYCVGGMIGGIITGVVADRFGRKGGLLINNVLVFIAVGLQSTAKLANSAEMLILGRLLIGVNSGLNAGLAPLYLAEISPVSLRGSIGTVYQLVITMTILLSQVLGLQSALGTSERWPWLLAVSAAPALIQAATLPLCVESPKYLLLNKGQELHAQRALNWLRGDVSVHGEMEEMHQEAEKNKISKKVTLRELFGNRQLRQPLLISMVIMIAQQLSGINAVIFYSTTIFYKVQLTTAQAQYATLGMGAMNVVMTVISLVLVEVAGRKTLLLSGFAGMFVCTVGLCVANIYAQISWVSYLCIALVILFVVMFAVGPGSIPWFLVTELFNQSARPAATSVAVTVNWTANFIVGLSFLPLSSALGPNVFIIFAVLQLLFIMFIFFKVPETKNKTVEEITAMFRQQM
ncbi:solute carrier family 2, facilitated glucose transporter member 1 [Helicoverpa armigera]|uniref:solute carrier family 2, facilitated glucose transporter member 1-like n=1 Tax=Helicoverpa zea TaxID=7113 RepID=UPI001F588DC7|nr:solute carrier family 2, facilitated glucose transporter member 1-like [Helicoverpa zea]XP_049695809.1 solute carrier family 2, facilitated glucose transporter member 1 isoform X1 [Helicoverpa armigera]